MKIIHSALLTTIAHLTKIAVGFILLKLIAYYLGAEGVGALGHFMSAVTILSLMAGGGLVNGTIKYVAEYRSQPRTLLSFISVVFTYSSVFSIVVFFLGVFYSQPIAAALLGAEDYYWLVVILAIGQLGFSFTSIVIGVCNGLRDTKTFSKIQVIGNLIALPVVWLLVANYGMAGSAVAVVMVFFICVFPAWYYFRISPFYGRVRFTAISGADFKKLSSYTLMLATSALAFPIVEIIVRESLIRTSGYGEAGIWQASIKLSSAYLGFFGVFLAYYFMPLVSPEKDKSVISGHALKFSFLVMSVFIVGATVLYLGRTLFIPLLLSKEFVQLENLILYQIIGDFFKISAYVFGFVAVAKAATCVYIVAEFVQSLLFLGFVFLLPGQSGVESVMMGYMIAYIAYFGLSLSFFIFWVRNESYSLCGS